MSARKSDLVIVMLHWMLVVVILGAAVTGILLWDNTLQPQLAFLFEPKNVGVIHICLSMATAAFVLLYLWYLNHKNFFSHIVFRSIVINKQVRWKYVNVLFYWVLFITIAVETVTGVLLTKLVNQDVLKSVFLIERWQLSLVHLYLVLPVLVFPVAHVMVHWLDGGLSKILSIFRPRVFQKKPSLAAIMAKLKEENLRLREKSKGVSGLNN